MNTPEKWCVMREDDNGNWFVVTAGLDRSQAQALRDEYDAKGHKQLYWIKTYKEGPQLVK